MPSSPDPRNIAYLPLAALEPDPANPKGHDEALIESSISRHGLVDMIVRDDRTGRLIAGHGRRKALTAMQEAGMEPPEGVRVSHEGEWLVPVVVGWESKSDLEARAALIALNRTGEVGGWVDEALLAQLDNLSAADGLDGTGYGHSDIDNLRAYLAATSLVDSGDEETLDPGDEIGDIPILAGTREVRVVYQTESRAALFETLHGLDYVLNVRDVAVPGAGRGGSVSGDAA